MREVHLTNWPIALNLDFVFLYLFELDGVTFDISNFDYFITNSLKYQRFTASEGCVLNLGIKHLQQNCGLYHHRISRSNVLDFRYSA